MESLHSPSKRLCVGIVVAPHGVRGAVRIKSFTAEPRDVAAYGAVSDEAGGRQMKLKVIGENKGAVLAEIIGVSDRTIAESLKGLRLYVERDRLPPVEEEDEFYHADLIGLLAVYETGDSLGTVSAVHDFGAGTSLEIVAADGATHLLPFLKSVVPVIDFARGRLTVIPPPGFFDKPEAPQGIAAEEEAEAAATLATGEGAP